MKDLLPLFGIVTVLNTPFTKSNEIHEEGLRQHVRTALNAGVAGFLVPAMASEAGKLTEAERQQVVNAVLEESRGRAVVIGGGSAPSAGARDRLVRSLVDAGCDGILVSLAYENEAQYTGDVEAVAALCPGFLVLQDWDFTGYGVPVPLVARLFADIEPFRGLKIEVVPAGRKYTEVLEATDGRLHVSGGWAVMQMIEALDRGVHAFMPTALHEAYVAIYNLYREGRRDDARVLFNRLLPVLAFSNQHLDISLHFFKRLLHAQGMYETPAVREPVLPFDAHHERVAAELIDYARTLLAHLRETPLDTSTQIV
ncbi:MAG: dihydrodipicolinate synthase family protein [FCB group bacterium]|nr:dihydrodipicolinate synthase family protein [FCB group bacterium]